MKKLYTLHTNYEELSPKTQKVGKTWLVNKNKINNIYKNMPKFTLI